MNEEAQEILNILRSLAEQSQLHDGQIAQNTANIQLLTHVISEEDLFGK